MFVPVSQGLEKSFVEGLFAHSCEFLVKPVLSYQHQLLPVLICSQPFTTSTARRMSLPNARETVSRSAFSSISTYSRVCSRFSVPRIGVIAEKSPIELEKFLSRLNRCF